MQQRLSFNVRKEDNIFCVYYTIFVSESMKILDQSSYINHKSVYYIKVCADISC